MENEYILIINIQSEAKNVFEKALSEEKYNVLENTDLPILLAKKTADKNINLQLEEKVLKLVINIAKEYIGEKSICIDLTKEVKSIMKKAEEYGEVDKERLGNYASWGIKQAIKDAIINSNEKEN